MNTLSYKTPSANRETVEIQWHLVDAEGQTLGRMASEVARILRGKHKPDFTPHVDGGDHVVIINADKIHLSGKKWDQKEYIRHTGYPGGQRMKTANQVMAKKPTFMVEKAIRGMLPKNKLGRRMFSKLHVYQGSEHPHEAQQPKVLNFNTKS